MRTTAVRDADRPGGGQVAAARPGGAAAALLSLQRTAGNAAVAGLVGDLPLQRMKIKGEEIKPFGANGRALWDAVRVALINANLSPWGAKKKFLEIAGGDTHYQTRDTFVERFVSTAKEEAGRVATSGGRGWTRKLQLRRPAWTAAHKANVTSGQNIRHVIRNATIKKALEAEYWAYGNERERLKGLETLAQEVGIKENFPTAWEYLRKIYVKAYLHLGNLHVGAGAINQVIGLTADSIWKCGIDLAGRSGEATADLVRERFAKVGAIVREQCASTRGQGKGKEAFLEGFDHFEKNFFSWLDNAQTVYLSEIAETEEGEEGVAISDIGSEFLDLSVNFSFDLPGEPAKEHAPVLSEVQSFLDAYDGSEPKILAQQLKLFFGLPPILGESSKT